MKNYGRDMAYKDAAEWLREQDIRCPLDCLDCKGERCDLVISLADLLLSRAKEVIELCDLNKGISWDTKDEYRRGQKRGSNDCVIILKRYFGVL